MSAMAALIEDHVQPIQLSGPVKPPASPIVAISGGSVGYEPGKPILKRLTLRIDADDRIALLGSNGNGKSTFAKLLSGSPVGRERHSEARPGAEDRFLRAAPAGRSPAGGLTPSSMCAG